MITQILDGHGECGLALGVVRILQNHIDALFSRLIMPHLLEYHKLIRFVFPNLISDIFPFKYGLLARRRLVRKKHINFVFRVALLDILEHDTDAVVLLVQSRAVSDPLLGAQ